MKKIFLFIALLYCGINAYAQEGISSIFMTIPDTILAGLNAEMKAELTANPDSTGIAVTNMLDEDVTRLALTDDYISFKTSDAGTLEMKLLPLVNNTDILGVIRTVCSSVCDSYIQFYTTDWQPLSQTDLFPRLDKNWFLITDIDGNSQDYSNAVAALDMTPVKLKFSPDKKQVIAECDIEGYLDAEDYQLIKPYLLEEPRVFTWDKLSFKP